MTSAQDNSPATNSPVVSIVIATYHRCERLKRCIEGIRANVAIAHETIVVGGSNGDGTEEWLEQQADLCYIRETKREGATKAYNKGFRAATGTYVMWLNDDSWPMSGSVEAAVQMIERTDLTDVGMIAFYHNLDREWNRLHTIDHEGADYSIYNVRGMAYANFGLLRRELLIKISYLDERYYFCAWDPDLALKIQLTEGLKVVGCRDALVYHEELIDDRKAGDMSIIDTDNNKLFDKWDLPAKFCYPDPKPAYQALIHERNL